ncbi:MAG: UDP-N-acetylglucosamine 1-carboxyvinyltransferase, partial [Oscillospiraceae bacterium]|nr:UDP-N-acetylglucosamine 1-carboxyvinyltransferase [Oscillospiraceae bacterium]
MEEQLRIDGLYTCHGELAVHGAKNSALPLLAATLLVPEPCVLHNCPPLSDVSAACAILNALGCRTSREEDSVTVDAAALIGSAIPDGLMREMRSSIVFLGPLLARAGQAALSFPGGCELGPRPIDLHLWALRKLGADIREERGELHCRT